MKALIQRVQSASVAVDGQQISSIGAGMLIFLGASREDSSEVARNLAVRLSKFRIFEDDAGKMNLSLLDAGAAALVVSQFTLCADLSRGNRPSFGPAAEPRIAEELYEIFASALAETGVPVSTGKFGADMKVALINDGPVTFLVQEPR
ncbi:MAG: D-tyrosyl-tRNA(Tyr) deacylase [Spirochaetaceae bacterium]|nr:D-tyrosyl-tRNA(Tyr) deacylase [Spirochaetaceae bacterium]|tara:strand:- start:14122 stop:14565 length:444 start_codon:yes stop_codon:yes gene_type:complete